MKESSVEVNITNFGSNEVVTELAERHQKNKELGNKLVYFYKQILLEREDIESCEVGEKITLMKWGNAIVKSKSDGN